MRHRVVLSLDWKWRLHCAWQQRTKSQNDSSCTCKHERNMTVCMNKKQNFPLHIFSLTFVINGFQKQDKHLFTFLLLQCPRNIWFKSMYLITWLIEHYCAKEKQSALHSVLHLSWLRQSPALCSALYEINDQRKIAHSFSHSSVAQLQPTLSLALLKK